MTGTVKAILRSKKFRIVAEIGFVVLVLAAVRAYQHRDLVSDTAPTLAGTTLAGVPFVLSEAKQRPIIVHFWATWCPICRLEQRSIESIARDYPVMTVAMQSGAPAEIQHHLEKENLNFPVIADPFGDIARRWGVGAVPATFVIDAAGRVRFVEIGYTTGLGLRARLALARWPALF